MDAVYVGITILFFVLCAAYVKFLSGGKPWWKIFSLVSLLFALSSIFLRRFYIPTNS